MDGKLPYPGTVIRTALGQPQHKAELIWRGRDDLDLALLQLIDDIKLKPKLQPVFVSYNLIEEVKDVSAV